MARLLSFLLLLLGLFLLSPPFPTAVEAKHFVLVHGMGHGGWCWYKITTLLRQAGHQVSAIDLTSNGISKVVADNVTSIAEYVQPLTQLLANNVTINDKVILVGHSFGGSAISYAMELYPEKINKSVFLAAAMPLNNEAFLPVDILQDAMFLFERGVVFSNFANGPSMPPTSFSLNLTLVREYFYNQSPLTDVVLAKSLLNPTPAAPTTEVLTLTPTKYGSIRRYYIRTDLDHVVLPTIQTTIIQKNPPDQVLFIPKSDHSAFFSRPIKLTQLLLSIA